AIAAVARQPHLLLDPAEACAIARIHEQRAGREQDRFGEFGAGADPQMAFPGGTAVARPPAVTAEALAGEGLVHHPEHPLAPSQQGDQPAPGRHPADERLRAVDRIEHPDIFRVRPLITEFLADDAMIRKAAADEGAHRGFGRMIGRGHGVEAAGAALVLDAERRAEEWQDGISRYRREFVHESRGIDWRHSRVFPRRPRPAPDRRAARLAPRAGPMLNPKIARAALLFSI